MPQTDSYQTDFYAWTQEQARLLRAGRAGELDYAHLAEEIEAMGASERRELINRLKILLAHLLKWQIQPGLRSASWEATIDEQREQIADLLRDNPSLKPQLDDYLSQAYPRAIRLAAKETGLSVVQFPPANPFSAAQIQDETYFPN